MKGIRRLSRRSFLETVSGGIILVGGAGALVAGRAAASQVTDRDPSDPLGQGTSGETRMTDADAGAGADLVSRGRPDAPPSGISDRDRAPYADIAGRGRGTGGWSGSGATDADPTDRPLRGRRGVCITDRDTSGDVRGDEPPRWRRAGERRGRGWTGVTDRDPSDRAGYGGRSAPDADTDCARLRRRVAQLETEIGEMGARLEWSEQQLAEATADHQRLQQLLPRARSRTDPQREAAAADILRTTGRWGVSCGGSKLDRNLAALAQRIEFERWGHEQLRGYRRELDQARAALAACG